MLLRIIQSLAFATLLSSCIFSREMEQQEKELITKNTDCYARYLAIPRKLAQCISLKNEHEKIDENNIKKEKELQEKQIKDKVLASTYSDAWDAFNDIYDYPPPGDYDCKLDTLKGMDGTEISYGTVNKDQCDIWIDKSHTIGKNKPSILTEHKDLIPLFLERDRKKALEICKIKGEKDGIESASISMSNQAIYGEIFRPADGRYHCNETIDGRIFSFYAFTHVNGKISDNERKANETENTKSFIEAYDNHRIHPFIAKIDCAGFPLVMCFGAGESSMLGQIEIKNGKDYKMYSGYDFLAPQFNALNLEIPLKENFTIYIRNGSGYNKINFKIYNSLSLESVFEKSAAPYGSIHVRN
jgi:hypothetical protein